MCGYIKEQYHAHPAHRMIARAKQRAKQRGLEFNLVDEDLHDLPKVCPVLGIELRASAKPQDTHAYSLDRVDNSKGYVRGNVVVMSYLANRLKNDGTAEQHEKIASWMRSKGMT